MGNLLKKVHHPVKTDNMKIKALPVLILGICLLTAVSCKKKEPAKLVPEHVKAGNIELNLSAITRDIPIESSFTIDFNSEADPLSASRGISLQGSDNSLVPCNMTFLNGNRSVQLKPQQTLINNQSYKIIISSSVTGSNGGVCDGARVTFYTVVGPLTIAAITVNGEPFEYPLHPKNVSYKNMAIRITFSDSLDPATIQNSIAIWPYKPVTFSLSDNKKILQLVNNEQLQDFTKTFLNINSELKALNGASFGSFSNYFYTRLDSTPKFPLIPDEELLTMVQERTFRYFYDYAHPSSGMIRERLNSGDVVTTGGSGFGVMALIVGMERGFITKDQGVARMEKILNFLETCDRFHGAWPHWLNGATGKTVPFTPNDNGADLVETSYMAQGLVTMRQYLEASVPSAQSLITRIDALTDAIEYDWFTRGQNVLYWHWSPNLGWVMNMQINGYNETLITYVMAAISTTHTISKQVYTNGYARNGGIVNGQSYLGYKLPLGDAYGGPLFFTHYSFLGLDPRTLSDQYASYWEQNVNQSLINWKWCANNARGWVGYSTWCWGLTASDNPWGYNAHSPANDLGVITPSAALSAIAYSPEQSLNALKFFYYNLGDRLWGNYGFYDAFDPTENWVASSFLAIDQGPIVCMIENYRTGLLWNLFMSSPKVEAGLVKLGFTH